jgi:uncharacterized membrane protein YbhN (UPF0104 family)
MMKRSIFLRALAAGVIVAATVAFLVRYLHSHPAVANQLGKISNFVLVGVFVLYILMFAIIMQLFSVTILLCEKVIKLRENFYINGYSIGLNFILPGQAGPVFRSGYAKRKYGIKFKTFLSATLLYYFFYTIISLSFVAIGSRPWWQSIISIVLLALVLILGLKWYEKKRSLHFSEFAIHKKWVLSLLALTYAQFNLQALIYFIELKAADHVVSLHQVISYTGIANLALFAGLTPAGIGIRESFLVLSEKIHQIPTDAIVVANLIDRSIYVLFIITVFLISIVLHKFLKKEAKA